MLNHLADYLVAANILTLQTATYAATQAKIQKIPLVSYLVKNNILTSQEILINCARIFNLPTFDLLQYDQSWLTNTPIQHEFICQYRVIPLQKTQQIFHIGLADPTNQNAIDATAFTTGLQIVRILVAENQIEEFINLYCQTQLTHKNLQVNLLKQISLEEEPLLMQENTHHDEPLIKFVDNIILLALEKNASDIHIEPYEQYCRVRYRQQGILYFNNEIPLTLATRVISRLKVMAKLDIAEKRLPQDGRFKFNTTDIRINTCPTLFGEKIVLRLLNATNIMLEIDTLGFTPLQKNIFLKKISQPQGMLLVTGPTGSGKTTTLYSALNYLNTIEKNISTVEDPIEIRLSGINQVNVNTKIGLNFVTALRTFLRQDPDIIMLGEIRDTETANIALQAAQTGHLVLSTLHTNSAIETIIRLKAMHLLAYHIIDSISLIIAQRLIRSLCPHCKQAEIISASHLAAFGIPTELKKVKTYRAVGCTQCLQGYLHRFAIYEFLSIDETMANLIIDESDTPTLIRAAKKSGFITLQEAGYEKVLQGITSLTEITRVLSL